MASVPVRVNRVTRPSRLFRGTGEYVSRSAKTILRVFVVYAPLRFFFTLAACCALPGFAGIGRFLYFYATDGGGGHIQSLVLSAMLLAVATILFAVGILADLIAANRSLLEDIRARDLMRAPSRSDVGGRRKLVLEVVSAA